MLGLVLAVDAADFAGRELATVGTGAWLEQPIPTEIRPQAVKNAAIRIAKVYGFSIGQNRVNRRSGKRNIVLCGERVTWKTELEKRVRCDFAKTAAEN